MTRSRSYQTTAAVLRYRPIGEADRIVTLYTSTFGRITAVAKGLRRPGSRFGGTLEPLNLVHISLSRGRSLDNVNECVAINSFVDLKSDLGRIAQGIYLAELIDTFGDDWAPNHRLFNLLEKTLRVLNDGNISDVLIPTFELCLLQYCGFRPEFGQCVECRKELEPGSYTFNADSGGVLCGSCDTILSSSSFQLSMDAMKILRWIQNQHVDIARPPGVLFPKEALFEVATVLRKYLKFVAERDLRSTRFLDHIESDKK